MGQTVSSEYIKIVKLLNELTGSKSMWQVFNDCVEMYTCCLQNLFQYGEKYKKTEKRYSDIINLYSKDECEIVAIIFAEIQKMAKENPFRDLLGNLYMQLGIGSKELGQFFTPYNVSLAMARLSTDIDVCKNAIEEKGYFTVSEPCAGGGANVIAVCEHLHNNGINYQKNCIIVCQELNNLPALMCYVILSLIGCSAVIKVGDTLADPYTNYRTEISKGSSIWTTPMFHINNCYCKV